MTTRSTRTDSSPLSRSARTDSSPLSRSEFFNRELSYLEFNRRIVEIASDPRTPVLEKLRFLTIFANNLDEFFMIRVSGIKKMLDRGETVCDSPERMPNTELCTEIRQQVELLSAEARQILIKDVVTKLRHDIDVRICKDEDLNTEQRKKLRAHFFANVLPMLTPLAVNQEHPFPHLKNLSPYLFVTFTSDNDDKKPQIGFVEIPANIDTLVRIDAEHNWFICLNDLITSHLAEVFVGYKIKNSYFVRVTRGWDYELVEDEVLDLLTTIQSEISQTHRDAVRLEADTSLPPPLLAELQKSLQLADTDTYLVDRPFVISHLAALLNLSHEKGRYPPFNPRLPKRLVNNHNVFELIANGDLLVHHPYESFYTVVEFLHEAAHDEQTLAIKQTLYRTSGDSPIIDTLIAAAENGKKVTAIVELKARFDEKNNILWAKRLEKAGVSVIYGFIHVKTHLKSTIVVRREGEKVVQYVHLSTGNYNPRTAKTYTDVSLFTANTHYGREIALLFNILTGYHLFWNEQAEERSSSPQFKKLAVAPFNLRRRIIANIDKEIRNHRKTNDGLIIAKMNALVDEEIIKKLYTASCAGVEIKLIVRGICCLKPQIKGLSENITVTSTVGRFLEHSRIFYFYAGGERNVFVSSADWMPRNMDRRVEVMYPILDPKHKEQIIEFILPIYANDSDAWHLRPDGTYIKHKSKRQTKNAHELLIAYARESGIKSIPYEHAIRTPGQSRKKKPPRPVAKP